MTKFFPYDKFCLIICSIFFIFYSAVHTLRFYHFNYTDWDLAAYSQSMWMLLNGSQYCSIWGANLFGSHSSFILLFILPIFAIFPHPLTLEILKIISFVMAGYILYRIVKKDLPEIWAVGFTALYLLFPPNAFAIFFDFNPEILAAPLLFLSYDFFKKKNLTKFFITTFFLMQVKENMCLIVFMFGVFGLLSYKGERLKWGVLPMLWGGITFCFYVLWLIPMIMGTRVHPFLANQYAHLGSSLPEVLLTLMTHPKILFELLVNTQNINYVRELFGPFLLPALFNWPVLSFISPKILQHFISNHPPEHTIYYHYAMSLTPFIFLASHQTFTWIWNKFSKNRLVIILPIVFLLNYFLYFAYYWPRLKEETQNEAQKIDTPHLWDLINSIDRSKGIISTFKFLPNLSIHPHRYSIHKLIDDDYQLPEKFTKNLMHQNNAFTVPENVEIAVIDLKDPWILATFLTNPMTAIRRYQNAFQKQEWTFYKALGDTLVLIKNDPSSKQLVEKSSTPFDSSHNELSVLIDDQLQLLSVSIEKFSSSDNNIIIPLKLYWKATQKIRNMYVAILTLKKGDKIVHQTDHLIGYFFYPTNTLNQGEYLKELFFMPAGPMTAGVYSIEMNLINLTTKAPINLKTKLTDISTTSINLGKFKFPNVKQKKISQLIEMY